jgi:hypothetical protein
MPTIQACQSGVVAREMELEVMVSAHLDHMQSEAKRRQHNCVIYLFASPAYVLFLGGGAA